MSSTTHCGGGVHSSRPGRTGRPVVLVVEDSDRDFALLASALGSAELALVRAASVTEAAVVLADADIACVLLDLDLPDVSGLGALDAVLAETSAAVVVLTGLDDEAVGIEAVSRGAEDHLVKADVSAAVLQRAVRYAIERGRSRDLAGRLARIHHFTAEVNRTVTHIVDRAVLLADACRIAVDVGGFRMAWAGVPTEDGTEIAMAAASGRVAGYFDDIRITADSEGPTATCFRTATTVVSEDIATDPRMVPWRAAAVHRGFASSAALPLVVNGSVIAVLSVYTGPVAHVTDEEVVLLERLAADISAALAVFEAEGARRRSEQRFEAVVQNSTDLIVVVDGAGTLLFGSPAANFLLGLDPATLVGTNVLDLIHPDDRDRIDEAHRRSLGRAGVQAPQEVRLRHADGTWRHFELIGNNLLDDPAVRGVVVNGRDITERKAVEQRLAAQASILELIARSSPLSETLELVADEVERHLPGRHCAIAIADDEVVRLHLVAAPGMPAEIRAGLGELSVTEADTPCGAAAASRSTVVVADAATDPRFPRFRGLAAETGMRSSWSTPILAYRGGTVLGTLAVYCDVPASPTGAEVEATRVAGDLAAIAIDRHRVEERLAHQALHDPLTGLPNRALFVDRLEHALRRSERDASRIAVLFLDLDRFKVVNDSLGHGAGDALLVAVGRRLGAVLRSSDTVARFGGDEFAMLCEQLDGESEAVAVAERIHEVLDEPIQVEGQALHVTASIGIAFGGDGADVTDVLLRSADVAMYRAKEEGRARTSVFDDEAGSRAAARLTLENALRRAIGDGMIEVLYQPEFDLRTGRIFAAEALVRWTDPELGSIPPSVFIPVAEETGLIWKLGLHVLETACLVAVQWQQPSTPISVSVNLSGHQLADPRLVDAVERALDESGLPHGLLCLEITESVLMRDASATYETLRELKRLGVQLAIDDFGTGYSSLAYLRRFPVDFLKIDRSFVEGIGLEAEDESIATAIIELAHSLGPAVIAEGIESAQQLAVLCQLGCDFGQGYLWSPATEADAIPGFGSVLSEPVGASGDPASS